MYNSADETVKHILTVQHFGQGVIENLAQRFQRHDDSKLRAPEKQMFDEFTPRLRSLTYGSPEYKACLVEMGAALQHHYEANSHHPEHFENGVNGMSLLDLLEMLTDWKAATLRHDDGDISESLEVNRSRFGLSEQLFQILENTIRDLGWDNAG